MWVFFFDDDFLELFKAQEDMENARDYLIRLRVYADRSGRGIAVPKPGCRKSAARSVESDDSDEDSRVAGSLFESTRNLLEECVWELANIQEGRVANPIEASRCGGKWVALRGRRIWSKHAVGVEGAGPGRGAASDAGAQRHVSDGVHLCNTTVFVSARG